MRSLARVVGDRARRLRTSAPDEALHAGDNLRAKCRRVAKRDLEIKTLLDRQHDCCNCGRTIGTNAHLQIACDVMSSMERLSAIPAGTASWARPNLQRTVSVLAEGSNSGT